MNQMNKFIIVSLDGNIGSGKSTLMENLKIKYKNNKKVIFLREPVDEWEKIKNENNKSILELFYENQEKYSFSFQVMAFISRLKILREAIRNIENDCIIITERSLYTDKNVFAKMLFDFNKIEYINYQIYLDWFDTFSQEYPINKVIYIKTNPEICHYRIMKRLREGEDNIPLEYLDNCHIYHDKMLDLNNNDCICKNQLILDGNVNLNDNENKLDEWLEQINSFIFN